MCHEYKTGVIIHQMPKRYLMATKRQFIVEITIREQNAACNNELRRKGPDPVLTIVYSVDFGPTLSSPEA